MSKQSSGAKIMPTKTYTKLIEVEAGTLVKFKNSSDVFRVLEAGYFATLKNMYSDKVSTFKCYTNKFGKTHDRTVEIVRFY